MQSNVDWQSNQSKLIEANRSIGFDCRMQSNGNQIEKKCKNLIDFDYSIVFDLHSISFSAKPEISAVICEVSFPSSIFILP